MGKTTSCLEAERSYTGCLIFLSPLILYLGVSIVLYVVENLSK